jgi:hypothetical protein
MGVFLLALYLNQKQPLEVATKIFEMIAEKPLLQRKLVRELEEHLLIKVAPLHQLFFLWKPFAVDLHPLTSPKFQKGLAHSPAEHAR